MFAIVQACRRTPRSTRPGSTPTEVNDVYRVVPGDRQHLPDHVPDGRLRRHGHQALERADEDDRAAPDRERAAGSRGSPASACIPMTAAAAAGRRRLPGRLRDRLDGRAAAAARVRQPARAEGLRERPVHLRRRRPQVRPAAGRGRASIATRCARRASTCARPGGDLATLLGGNYVNRFSIQGRSYKVIPQVEAQRAADARPARRDLRHGRRTASSCRCRTFATLRSSTSSRAS